MTNARDGHESSFLQRNRDPAVAAFYALVLEDPGLQARLSEIEDPEHFVAAAQAVAGDAGLQPPSREALLQALQPDRIGLSRWSDAPVTRDRWPDRAWLPARSVLTDDGLMFDWARFGTRPLSEPFFEDSIRRIQSRPFNLMFRTRTSLADLAANADFTDSVKPTGFIFHMSRCGSTLAAQMLAAVPGHIVLSEPGPVDGVLQWANDSDAPLAEKVAALRAVVAALGRDRTGGSHRLFIKLDSWHAMALPLFRAAFPDVSWIFLYREPVEVMVSHARMPGGQVVQGVLKMPLFEDNGDVGTDDYAARSLATICRAAADHMALGGGLLVEYRDLAESMLRVIPEHMGFTPDAEETAAMVAAAKRDAKVPSEMFTADAEEKRAAARPRTAAAAEFHLRAVYDRLQSLREGIESGARTSWSGCDL